MGYLEKNSEPMERMKQEAHGDTFLWAEGSRYDFKIIEEPFIK